MKALYISKICYENNIRTMSQAKDYFNNKLDFFEALRCGFHKAYENSLKRTPLENYINALLKKADDHVFETIDFILENHELIIGQKSNVDKNFIIINGEELKDNINGNKFTRAVWIKKYPYNSAYTFKIKYDVIIQGLEGDGNYFSDSLKYGLSITTNDYPKNINELVIAILHKDDKDFISEGYLTDFGKTTFVDMDKVRKFITELK